MNKEQLIGMPLEDLEERFVSAGEPRYRATQLYHALYRERQWDLEKIAPLSMRLRERLQQQYAVRLPQLRKSFRSTDGTTRLLLRLDDGTDIETVVMPEERRTTYCVSTQAGCAVDCKFCLTGVMGFGRNLSPAEIVGQVLVAGGQGSFAPERRLNLVFMGMGEPLYNYDSSLAAIRLLADPSGIGIFPARMTLSTAGVVPGIERLGKEPLRPKLAVSLNAPTDELRERIMPINRRWPLSELMRACREFPLRPRERLTFEYVLLDGVNDSPENARQLANLVKSIPCKVNLIGLNPGPDLPFETPAMERITEFQRIVRDKGVPTYLRKPRGRDIFAACGQLKLEQG